MAQRTKHTLCTVVVVWMDLCVCVQMWSEKRIGERRSDLAYG